MCTSECSNKLRYIGIDVVYIGVKLLYKHDGTPQRTLKKRCPALTPNDIGEMSFGKVRQDNLAFQIVLREVFSSLLITEPNVEGDVRIRRRRLRTLKRIPSRSGFTRFRCHSIVYPREREREREHITTRKEKKRYNVCMKNA